MKVRMIRKKFGFKLGDICTLSAEYFSHTKSKQVHKRRFEVIGFGSGWRTESIHVKRLDLTSGKRGYYHHSFLTKLRAGESY